MVISLYPKEPWELTQKAEKQESWELVLRSNNSKDEWKHYRKGPIITVIGETPETVQELTVKQTKELHNKKTKELWERYKTKRLPIKELHRLKTLLQGQEVQDIIKINRISKEINRMTTAVVMIGQQYLK
jgi:hypothetical protein